jgi:predicted MFS family arabinose efflux permease
MLLASAGIAVLFFTDSPAAIIAGMAAFGLGLGAVQNLSLTLMLENTHAGDFARVSVLWNIAFDAGMGIGSVAFGYLAIVTGYPWGFVILGVVMALTVAPTRVKRVR